MNVLVACSNPIRIKDEYFIESLGFILGDKVVVSEYLGSDDARAKAAELNHYFEINAANIFDISGGDLANGVLDYLDYHVITKSKSIFYGYSDLTTVLNAIYSQTKKQSWYYQLRFCSYYPEILENILNHDDHLEYEFVQGEKMAGIAIGGNIRCFLKLAGTRYMPDFTGHILFMEAYSSNKYQVISMLNQLAQMGAFDKVEGLILGTFTKLDQSGDRDFLVTKIREFCSKPIATTQDIGHHQWSKGFAVGRYYQFDNNSIRD